MTTTYRPADIARVAHEANRALQIIQNDPTIPVSPSWDDLDVHTRNSVIDGIGGVIYYGHTPEESHANWLAFKKRAGWTYGEVKDVEAKTHPLMVPYADLPAPAKVKDALFVAIIKALDGQIR